MAVRNKPIFILLGKSPLREKRKAFLTVQPFGLLLSYTLCYSSANPALYNEPLSLLMGVENQRTTDA